MEEVIEEVQRTTDSHQIVSDMEQSRQIFADRDRIGQVITNFLTNAIKYSPKANKVEVFVNYNDRAVKLSVHDYGLGLSREDQEKVFERFFRVEGKDRETLSGLGLGLFISSEIIQRHEGAIGVESRVGEGSDFYFTLPLTETQ